jgi:hypothetical protein
MLTNSMVHYGSVKNAALRVFRCGTTWEDLSNSADVCRKLEERWRGWGYERPGHVHGFATDDSDPWQRSAGRRYSGHSMLCPYGILLRQGASGSRKREQAPALQRDGATLNLEIGGRESQKRRRDAGATKGGTLALRLMAGIDRLGRASAGAACCAPTGCCYGKARPGAESATKGEPRLRSVGEDLI